MSKRRLGKGIDALLQGRDLEQLSNISSIHHVDISSIHPNPDQPRKHFPEESLKELSDSIREKGVIQPILAEDQGDGQYVIVAGERRYRAAQMAGLEQIPVISQEFSADEKLEIALIENIQREDLNPVDEARALQHILQHGGGTQDELAKRLGKSRSAIANSLRLLKLDPQALDSLAAGSITAGHARALLAVDSDAGRRVLFNRIIKENLSVRAAEFAARGEEIPAEEREPVPGSVIDSAPGSNNKASGSTGSSGASGAAEKSPELEQIEEQLIEHLGSRVVVRGTNHAGKIEITYVSSDDLERIIERMGMQFRT